MNNRISFWNQVLMGVLASFPIIYFLVQAFWFKVEHYESFLGLFLVLTVGFSSFSLLGAYETTEKVNVVFGYGIFWFCLGFSFIVGKSILLPILLEFATFSIFWIYSGTKFGNQQMESLRTLILVSGISVVFISSWIFLPTGSILGLSLLTIALLLKTGFLGFHFWLPKVNDGGPSHALGAFAGVLEVFPLILFYEFVLPYKLTNSLVLTLFMLSAVGIFLGGVAGFFQKKVKLVFAYSSIESIHFLWLCLFTISLFQFETDPSLQKLTFAFRILFFIGLLHHSFSKSFQFFSFGILLRLTNDLSVDHIKGVGRLIDISPLLMGIGSFSFAVLPGTIGFLSESTYFFINSRILDLPIGKSVFLLPAMIFIFFGMVLGGFAHLKIYFGVFLSNPKLEYHKLELEPKKIKAIRISLINLAFWIVFLPLVAPFLLDFFFHISSVDKPLYNWFLMVGLVSFVTQTIICLVYYLFNRYKVTNQMKESWDCGNNYSSEELSIPSTEFSKPLFNSLGRYFLDIDGKLKVDRAIFNVLSYLNYRFLNHIKNKDQNRQEEDISGYLAFASLFFILTFVITISVNILEN